jgi:hypothetical protein
MKIEGLKALVGRSEHKMRIKFSVKLLHVLNYTSQNRELIPETGAVWCADGIHFLVHSKILGNFLGLKSNTINTNFRDHGFKILAPVLPKDLDELQNLPDAL